MFPLKTIAVWAFVLFLSGTALLAWQMRAPAGVDHRQEIVERLLLEHLADQSDVTAKAERRAAEYADSQFTEKFNAHANAMNLIKADRENHVANVKHFAELAHTWAKFYGDPGYLKRDRGK